MEISPLKRVDIKPAGLAKEKAKSPNRTAPAIAARIAPPYSSSSSFIFPLALKRKTVEEPEEYSGKAKPNYPPDNSGAKFFYYFFHLQVLSFAVDK